MLVVAAALLAAPLAADADVIGRRKADRTAIERRLVEAGADASEASRLPEADARYFAAAPERVQAAGHGDLVWVGCCSGLCALIVLVLILL